MLLKKNDGPPTYQLLALMDPRDDVIFHDLNLAVHSNHSQNYVADMVLIDEKDPAYVACLFGQVKAFYVVPDYVLPPPDTKV